MKRYIKLISIITTIILVIASFVIYINLNKYRNTPLEPIKNMVEAIYFNKHSYETYSSSFTNPSMALDEEQFKQSKKSLDVNSEFRYGASNSREILNHMKVILNGDTAQIYYVEDKEKSSTDKMSFWTVVKKDDKWLIKND